MTPQQLNTIVRSFIMKYAVAGQTPGNPVFLGYPNQAALPASKTFFVFTKLYAKQLSWGTEFFDVQRGATKAEDVGTWTAANLYRVVYQVEAYGKPNAERLDAVQGVWRSGIAAEYMRQFRDVYGGISVIGSSDSQSAPRTDGTPEYATRNIVDLHLSTRLVVHVPQDWLEELHLAELKGVL